MGYKQDAIKGVTWLGAFRIITRIISFIRTAIIARVLTPADFGVFGIASLALSFIEVFTETGINIFLIQQRDEIDSYIDTAWIVSILRGIVIALLIFFLAPYISLFFQAKQAELSLQVMALIPLARGFINPSVAKFIKDLEFYKEFYYRTSIFIVESITTLIFVFISPHSLSLVLGLVVGAIFEAILSFFLAKPTPHYIFKKKLFFKVLHYGKWLTLAGIFDYLYQNIDNIIVGKILGTAPLGLYNMGYRISSIPISEFSDVLSRATFPVYAKISHDKNRLLKAFYKSLGITVLLVLPISIIFFIWPVLIVEILLGHKWISIVPILKILALFGSLRAILYIVNGLFYSVHRQDVVTKIAFISFLGLFIPIIPLIHLWGTSGAALSALIGTIIAYPVSGYYYYQIFHKNPDY